MDLHESNGGEDEMDEQKLLITVSEAAARLGLGRSFVYQLVMKGDIPSIKLGRARRVPVSGLERFITERMSVDES